MASERPEWKDWAESDGYDEFGQGPPRFANGASRDPPAYVDRGDERSYGTSWVLDIMLATNLAC